MTKSIFEQLHEQGLAGPTWAAVCPPAPPYIQRMGRGARNIYITPGRFGKTDKQAVEILDHAPKKWVLDYKIPRQGILPVSECESCHAVRTTAGMLLGRFCDECVEICGACNGAGGSDCGVCTDCYGQGATPNSNKEQDMNTEETISLMQITGGATVFSAKYQTTAAGGGLYHFKNVIGLPLEVGSLVVVETKGSFQIVEVVDPNILPTDIQCNYAQLKHAVALVHNHAYEMVLAAERNARHQLSLSVLQERLMTMKEQLGGSGFEAVQALLSNKGTAEVLKD